MEKQEILEKSKAEFKGNDPYFSDIQSKYMNRGLIVAIVMATVFYLTELIVRRNLNLGFLAIIAVNTAALNWAIYKQNPKTWRRVVAVLATTAVVLAAAGHFVSLFFL